MTAVWVLPLQRTVVHQQYYETECD